MKPSRGASDRRLVNSRRDFRRPENAESIGLYGDDAQRRAVVRLKCGDWSDAYLLPRETALEDAEAHLRVARQAWPGRYTLRLDGGASTVVDIGEME